MKKTIKILMCLLVVVLSLTTVAHALTLTEAIKELEPVKDTEPEVKINRGEVLVDGSTNVDKTGTIPTNPFTETDTGYYQGDKMIMTDNFVLEESVNGNVYVMGENVKLQDKVVVLGNVFVFGNNVESSANISGSLFAFGDNITVNGECNDMYAAGSNIVIDENAYIARDVKVAGSNLTIKGNVVRDLFSACDLTTIGGGLFSNVGGKVAYAGTLSASDEIQNKAMKVENKISSTTIEEDINTFGETILGFIDRTIMITKIASAFILVIMAALIFNNRREENENIFTNILKGFGMIVGIFFLMLILCMTIVGIPVALLILVLYLCALMLAGPVAAVTLAQKAFKEKGVLKLVVVGTILAIAFEFVGMLNVFGTIFNIVINSYGFYKLGTIFKTNKNNIKEETAPVIEGEVK